MTTKKTKVTKAKKPLSIKTTNGKMLPPHQKSSSAGAKMPTPNRVSGSAQPAVIHRTTAEINVSEKHSLELAKTVMIATISTIASLRDIFPRHRFAIRTYDCADPEVTYESFVNGSSGKFTFERSEDTLNWKILTRGSDNHDGAVNKLLDWIEIAATDALQKKYLAKLQLSFHSIDDNSVSDLNLLEAYSICFSYENGFMHVGTAEGKNDTANSVVLRGAKKDLYTLVNDVACMIQERDPLPVGRRMKMALLYNDTCPQDYEPPGFHADNNPKSLIASNKGSKIGSMNTGFHGISVNLFQRDPQNSQSSQLSSKRSRIRLRSPSISSETDGGGTQEHGLKLLQGMGKYRVPGTEDTQPLNATTSQQSARDEARAVSQSTPAFLPYTQDVISRIDDKRRQKVDNQSYQESDDLDELHSSGRPTACECGALIVESDLLNNNLIQCDLCDNFKHIHCYGHLGGVPPALKFACYSCLFDLEEILVPMKLTCVKRRALYYLREHGALNSLEEMARHLDIDQKIAEDILSQLAFEGYIEEATNYQKVRKGKGNLSKPLYTLIADEQKLLGHFFRPELDMGHYLTLPASLSSGNLGLTGGGNVNPQPDRVMSMSSIENSPSPSDVPRRTPYCQTALADASSTEGTLSPNSTLAGRLPVPQNQPRTRNGRLSPFGVSVGSSLSDFLPGTKRPHDSTPDRELMQPILNQKGTIRVGLDHNLRKRTKISIVNSPWTFRSAGL